MAEGGFNNFCNGLLADTGEETPLKGRFRFREGRSSFIEIVGSIAIGGEDGGGVCKLAALTAEPLRCVCGGLPSPGNNSAVSIRTSDGCGSLTGFLGLGTVEPGLRVAVVVMEACDIFSRSRGLRICRREFSLGSNSTVSMGFHDGDLTGFFGLGTVEPGLRVAVVVLEACDILSCPLVLHDACSLLSHSASSA